jgi:hypothetical protein
MGSPMERVGTALLRDTNGVGDAMVERILREVPVYARAPQAMLDDVVALAARNAEVMCGALAAERLPSRNELGYVAGHVRRRVYSGVRLEPLIHAYRVGNAAFWSLCVAGAVEQGMSRDSSLDVARNAFEVADAMTTQAAETFVREEGRAKALDREAARDLLEILLAGEVATISDEPHVAAPGLDPRAQMVVAVCTLNGSREASAGAFEETLASIASHLAIGGARPLIAMRQSEIVTVMQTSRADQVAERIAEARSYTQEHGLDLRAGVSLEIAGFAGVRDGYRLAAAALSYATREHPVMALDALSALDCALLTANAATRSIIVGKAAPLAALEDRLIDPLRDTVFALAQASLNVTEAARRLHVHHNTLRYRLERIKLLTGHDPATFNGLMEILCMLRVLGHEPA